MPLLPLWAFMSYSRVILTSTLTFSYRKRMSYFYVMIISKNTVGRWDVTPLFLVEFHRCFGGTCCLLYKMGCIYHVPLKRL